MSFATVFQQRKALVIALGAVLAVGVIGVTRISLPAMVSEVMEQ